MPRNANQSKSSNYSMGFNGSEYITCNEKFNFVQQTGVFSISCWIKFDNYNANSLQTILQTNGSGSSQHGFWLAYDNRTGIGTNTIFFSLYRGAGGGAQDKVEKTSAISDNNFHHIVVVSDGTNMNLFIDNSNVATFNNITTSPSGVAYNNLEIGRYSSSNPFAVDGSINNACIFDYALSSDQVTTLWGGGTEVFNPMALPSPPIAYYPLGTSAWNGEYLAENNAIGDYVFDFDSSNNNYIDTPQINLGSTNSISFWINKSLTAQGTLFGDPNGSSNYSLFIIPSTNSIYFRLGNSNSGYWELTVSSGLLNDGNWHHHCLTRNGVTLNYYIDRVLQTNVTNNTLNASAGTNTTIENIMAKSDGTLPLSGKLNGVSFFDYELTPSQVTTLYNYGSPIRTLANIPQNSNLKAWYKLDASEVYNSSTTEWKVNNALSPWTSSLDFDGSNDYIDCGNSLTNGFSQLTISIWANFASVPTNMVLGLASKDNTNARSFDLRYIQNTGVNFLVSTDGVNSTVTPYYPKASISAGQWIHFVGIYDGSNVLLYVNGAPIGSPAALTGSLQNTTSEFFIGKRGFGTTNTGFDGQLSNVAVFNTGLSQSQVTTLYNNGTPEALISHSPVSWWKLNNTTTGIEDSKGSNDGTNNGATEVYGSVSKLNGESSGMSQANLVQSDLQTVAPYSKYAMDFDASSGDYIDCGNDSSLNMVDNGTDSFTFSFWIKRGSTNNEIIISKQVNSGSYNGFETSLISNKIRVFLGSFQSPTAYLQVISTNTITGSDWKNVVITYDGSQNVNGFNIYINKVPETLVTLQNITPSGILNSANFQISGRSGLTLYDGYISNLSYWNTDLTPAQVTEIYNQGLPSDLNSHSAYSNLVSWWQLGENSSFDGNDWICADEKGTNNGTSVSMPVGALVNGVGTTANGVSSGMSEGNLVGDAPYSTANAISSNMIVTSRVSGSGNTP